MFLDLIEKPIQKFFVFISALTFVEPLTDMPIGGVQYLHIFPMLPSLQNCCKNLIHIIIADTRITFQAINSLRKKDGRDRLKPIQNSIALDVCCLRRDVIFL